MELLPKKQISFFVTLLRHVLMKSGEGHEGEGLVRWD